jgi:hypothetical protein
MIRDWWVEMLYPDTSTAAGMRLMLWARYRHIELRFTTEPDSGKFEASWDGGNVVAGSADELFARLREELRDCDSQRHDWVTVSEKPDPNNDDSILRTQRLKCISCDSRERVITVPVSGLLPGGVPSGGRQGK